MKKILLITISLFMIIVNISVKAECNDEELNEWATKVEAKFTEATKEASDEYGYAYFLSITPVRDDVIIKAYDEYGNSEYGKTFEKMGLYGVGCYTNLEEAKYKIEVYAGENSTCNGELLKTLTYTVPRLNRMIKNDICTKYPEHELCQTFTDKTKDMSEAEFKKEMDKYDDSMRESSPLAKLIMKILGYGIFAIVPIIIVAIIYETKIKKVKKEKRMK